MPHDPLSPRPLSRLVLKRGSRLCGLHRLEVKYEIGWATMPPGGRFLSIAGIRPNIFEAMLDLNSVNATLLEATQIDEVTITVRDAGEDPRHPQASHTHREVIEEPTDRTQGAPAGWTSYGRGVYILANSGRDAGLIPRLDKLKADGQDSELNLPLDAVSQQTYTINGSDPDDGKEMIELTQLPGYAHLPVDWGFIQGLSFAHVEVSGALQQLLSGARHLNSFQTVDAVGLYPYLDQLPL